VFPLSFLADEEGRETGRDDRVGVGDENGRDGCPQLGSLDSPVEEGKKKEKSKKGSLLWGVQSLLIIFHF